jgi:hypothetical protein
MQLVKNHGFRAAQLILGAIFTIFGLNGFLGFLPTPPMPEAASSFFGALAATGYMLPLIKGTEVLAGLLLLGNRFVPLALLLLAPIVVNIVAFHAFLAPAGLALPVLVVLLTVIVAWSKRDVFAPLLSARQDETPARRKAGIQIPTAA